MIEVNLLPTAQRGARGKSSLLSRLPRMGRPARVSPWNIGVALAWTCAPALVGWLHYDARSNRMALERAIAAAEADSARYAAALDATRSVQAQRDTIAQKLAIIQEIDASRYTWAHIMDEVSRALPNHTWLIGLTQVEGGPRPRFRIEGRTGNHLALTQFMSDLELSPFVRAVRLAETHQLREDDQLVHAFVLEGSYEDPSPEFVELVPLFSVEE